MKLSIVCLVLLGLTANLCAQETPPEVPKPLPRSTAEREAEEKRAEEILKAIDARMYYLRNEGLEDIRYRWRMTGSGALSSVDCILDYAWKQPGHERLQVLDVKGQPLTELPEAMKGREQEFQFLLKQMVAMSQTLVLGLPFATVYADYFKEVREREVNNKIETSVILVPRTKRVNAKVVLRIRDGLPREIVKTSESGHENHLRYRYEKRGTKYIVTGFSSEVANTLMQEEKYEYITVKDLIVLKSVTRMTRQVEDVRHEVHLTDIQVNSGLPVEFFEVPQPAAEKR